MIPLDFRRRFPDAVPEGKYALIGCIGFEDRSTAVAQEVANHSHPRLSFLLRLHNPGGEWAAACAARSDTNLETVRQLLTVRSIFDLRVMSPDLDAQCELVAETAAAEMSTESLDLLVVDMTTMPKVVMFPLLRALLRAPQIGNLLVAYTEPGGYSRTALHVDPIHPPASLAGLNRLEPGTRPDLAWIPILGFGSYFAGMIHESLVSAGSLEQRIFPLLGFPGFDPGLYHRVLLDNGRRLLALSSQPRVRDRFMFAPAWDPFATRDAILSAIELLPESVSWVGSPLGPRPMALGMLLAALRSQRLTVITAQARSYNPEYSSGAGKIHLYPIRLSREK